MEERRMTPRMFGTMFSLNITVLESVPVSTDCKSFPTKLSFVVVLSHLVCMRLHSISLVADWAGKYIQQKQICWEWLAVIRLKWILRPSSQWRPFQTVNVHAAAIGCWSLSALCRDLVDCSLQWASCFSCSSEPLCLILSEMKMKIICHVWSRN